MLSESHSETWDVVIRGSLRHWRFAPALSRRRGTTALAPPDRAPAGRLLVERLEREGRVLLTLYGEVDLESSRELRSALEAANDPKVTELAIDLDGLSFMDSTGLQLLVAAAQQARNNDRELILRRVPMHARRLFEVTGMLELFKIRA